MYLLAVNRPCGSFTMSGALLFTSLTAEDTTPPPASKENILPLPVGKTQFNTAFSRDYLAGHL